MPPSLAESCLLRSYRVFVYQTLVSRIPSVYDVVNKTVYDAGRKG